MDESISEEESVSSFELNCLEYTSSDSPLDDYMELRPMHRDLNNLTPLHPRGEQNMRAIRHISDSILHRFYSRNSKKPPRKEYLRMSLIRKHKKTNRCISNGEKPKLKLKLNESPEARELWETLCDIYIEGKLGYMSTTESGPLTDGRSKRVSRKRQQKTFNRKFIQSYFKKDYMKKSYFYFIELLFLFIEPTLLCYRLNIRCCLDNQHTYCYQKWESMKHYVQFQMLEQLSIHPWVP